MRGAGDEEVVGSHVIYHVPFAKEVGVVEHIGTRQQALQFVKSRTLDPDENKGGSTSIQTAILYALDKIESSRSVGGNEDLQYASISVITDGDDGAVDVRAISQRIESLGPNIEININVIFILKTNEALKALIRAEGIKRQSAGKKNPFSFKHISQDDMNRMDAVAKAPPAIDPDEIRAPMASEMAKQGGHDLEIRRAVDDVAQAAVLARPEALRLLVESESVRLNMERIFSPEQIPQTGISTVVARARKIVDALDEALGPLMVEFNIPLEARPGFLNRLVTELCLGESLERKSFERALADASFTRTRTRIHLWLRGQ